MHTEYFAWGLKMTVIGMGLVFAMLGLLWVLLTIILMLDKPDEEEEEAPAASASDESDAYESASPPASAGLPADLVSAITVAAIKHRAALQGGSAAIMPTTWPGSQQSNWVVAGRARQTNTWTPRGK
ncbi:MAG: OadG family protein [Candidatus Accumulibacter sp.]|jgi:Na+-transporting methylmalonyl-CoA/oxaloacetate decarboxylase gamma subunit|nr:OadG family protein [Accumulibacter sp.]